MVYLKKKLPYNFTYLTKNKTIEKEKDSNAKNTKVFFYVFFKCNSQYIVRLEKTLKPIVFELNWLFRVK